MTCDGIAYDNQKNDTIKSAPQVGRMIDVVAAFALKIGSDDQVQRAENKSGNKRRDDEKAYLYIRGDHQACENDRRNGAGSTQTSVTMIVPVFQMCGDERYDQGGDIQGQVKQFAGTG